MTDRVFDHGWPRPLVMIDATEQAGDMLVGWSPAERLRWEDDGGAIPPDPSDWLQRSLNVLPIPLEDVLPRRPDGTDPIAHHLRRDRRHDL